MGFLDKAKDLLSKNADKVDTVIDKAGDLVDKKTQGKYASTVDKVQEAARKAVNDQTGQPGQTGQTGQTGQPGQTGQTGQPGQTGTPATPPVPPRQEPPTAPPVS